MVWPTAVKICPFSHPRVRGLSRLRRPSLGKERLSVPICQAEEHTGGSLLHVVTLDETVRGTKTAWKGQRMAGLEGVA